MTQQLINIGSVPNDGTGDPLRSAMNKVNQNFTDLYTTPLVSGNVSVGNSTVNVFANSTTVTIGNTTVNSYMNSTAHVIANTTGTLTETATSITVAADASGFISVGNSSVNAYINSTGVVIGNSTANSTSSQLLRSVANTTGTTTVTPYSVTVSANGNSNVLVGNASINATINSSSIVLIDTLSNVSVNTNTLYIGNTQSATVVNSIAVTANTINAISVVSIGTPSGFNFAPLATTGQIGIEGNGNSNNYFESVWQNANTGNNSSTDLVLVADSGNDSVNFIDLGINGSGYNQSAFNIGGALDAYLYSSNSNLAIGTAANNGTITFHANGTTSTDAKMYINATAVTVTNTVSFTANVAKITTANVGTLNSNVQVYISNTNGNTTITPTSLAIANVATINSTGIFTVNSVVLASNGVYSNGQFNGTYGDGIVMDYVTGMGRVSVGTADGISFYTNNVAGNLMFSANLTLLNVNAAVNSTSYTTGGGVASITGGVTVNATAVAIGNSTVNVSTNSTHFFAGNSTYYGFGNSTVDALVSPNGNAVLTPTSLVINSSSGSGSIVLGNTSACTSIGIGTISAVNATITSNTLTLGSSTSAANGYTYLPNGIRMMWGWVAANSSVGSIAFSPAFTTNAYSITATGNTPGTTYGPAVTGWTKSAATVLTTNTATINVFWMAIGV